MRSLPWLRKTDGQSAKHTDALEGDMNTIKEEEGPETAEVESSEQLGGSETEDEEDGFKSGDNATDTMISGYNHDDAYIMVENDLLEGSLLFTRRAIRTPWPAPKRCFSWLASRRRCRWGPRALARG